jgi:hypothetical protein
MLSTILLAVTLTSGSKAYHIPATPSFENSGSVGHSTVGVSIEFFAFPEYTTLVRTSNCLAHLKTLRGSDAPVRIGGTTQFVSDIGNIRARILTLSTEIERYTTRIWLLP